MKRREAEEKRDSRMAAVDIPENPAGWKVIRICDDSAYPDDVSLRKLLDARKIVDKVFAVQKRAS